ncbi:MAG: hypothetical protein IPH41_18440 [Sulfuritalea sp.]|jgi:hypothetical protein|nr:hypothetical protein [Sulfuritalea sp.]
MSLSRVTSISTSDLFMIWSSSAQDYRLAPFDVVMTALANQIATDGEIETQYSAPAATGFSVTIAPSVDGNNVWLLLTPVAGYAAGTVVLPALATLADGQEVIVSTTQAITTLTVSLNGATAANGAPTTMAANAYFRLKYDATLSSWYRIG